MVGRELPRGLVGRGSTIITTPTRIFERTVEVTELPNIDIIRAISNNRRELREQKLYLERRAEIAHQIAMAAEYGHMEFVMQEYQLPQKIAEELKGLGYIIESAHHNWITISWGKDND